MKKQPIKITQSELADAKLALRALDHSVRAKIIRLLKAAKDGLAVSEISAELDISQSDTSRHLAELKNVNLVRGEKFKKFVFYYLNKQRYDKVMLLAGKFK